MAVAALPESDTALAALAGEGSEAAFAALYERYFARLHDFTLRILRDPDLANEAVQGAFMSAWEALGKRGPPEHFKAWLYAIARNGALRELEQRKRLVPEGEGMEEAGGSRFDRMADEGADPETQAERWEAASLVWAAASGLGARDYALLDMHLRQQLQPEEIAAALGATRGNVYTMLSRLRDALEESVTAEILRRRGRRHCGELDRLVAEAGDGALTPALRRAVQGHLRVCPTCEEAKRRYVAPAAIFAGIAVVAVPLATQDAIWAGIADQIGGASLSPSSSPRAGARADGGAAGRTGVGGVRLIFALEGRGRLVAAGSAVLGIAAVVAALVVLLGGGGASPAFGDPDDVRSTSHVVGEASERLTVQVVWTPVDGASGYSVRWSELADELPPAMANLLGDAAGAASEPLEAGAWYFHLRTRSAEGEWTRTVHLGPFVLVEAEPPAEGDGAVEGARDGGHSPDEEPALGSEPAGPGSPPAPPPREDGPAPPSGEEPIAAPPGDSDVPAAPPDPAGDPPVIHRAIPPEIDQAMKAKGAQPAREILHPWPRMIGRKRQKRRRSRSRCSRTMWTRRTTCSRSSRSGSRHTAAPRSWATRSGISRSPTSSEAMRCAIG